MSAGILIELDGVPTDLSLVDWYLKAPCGCVSGVTLGYLEHGPRPALVVVTADAAFDAFYETKRERTKFEALGFTVFPDLHSKVREHLTDCPHEPKWGYARPVAPDGHSWAAVCALGRRPQVKHLVPAAGVENAKERRYGAGDTPALCGSKAFHWSDERHAMFGLVECARCEARAQRLVTGGAA